MSTRTELAPIGYHRRFSHDLYDHNTVLSFPDIAAAVESLFIHLLVHLRVQQDCHMHLLLASISIGRIREPVPEHKQ